VCDNDAKGQLIAWILTDALSSQEPKKFELFFCFFLVDHQLWKWRLPGLCSFATVMFGGRAQGIIE